MPGMSIAGGLFQGGGERDDEDDQGTGLAPPARSPGGFDIDLETGRLVVGPGAGAAPSPTGPPPVTTDAASAIPGLPPMPAGTSAEDDEDAKDEHEHEDEAPEDD